MDADKSVRIAESGNLTTYKQNDGDQIRDAVNTFVELNIPLDFHHTN